MKERLKIVKDGMHTEHGLLFLEKMQYGFWLRFASEHFIPCNACQEKLDKLIGDTKLAFADPNCITLEEYPKKNEWRFLLRFLAVGSLSGGDVFTPCKECQSVILRKFNEKELHIGSDEKPLVELWRRFDFDPYHPLAYVFERPNNAFVKEECVLCGDFFDADLEYIWTTKVNGKENYLCYKCGPKQAAAKKRDEK